jgi:hypothetical protein
MQFATDVGMSDRSRPTKSVPAAPMVAVVLFLVSDEVRFINGALFDINGGRFLR